MMKRPVINVFLLGIAFFSLSLSAQTPKCSEPLAVVYINGVFNTKPEANRSLEKLREKTAQIDFQKYEFSAKKSNFVLSYNETNGLLDLFEVFRQKRNELDRNFLKVLYGIRPMPKLVHGNLHEFQHTDISRIKL
jgi:hypothetical protein